MCIPHGSPDGRVRTHAGGSRNTRSDWSVARAGAWTTGTRSRGFFRPRRRDHDRGARREHQPVRAGAIRSALPDAAPGYYGGSGRRIQHRLSIQARDSASGSFVYPGTRVPPPGPRGGCIHPGGTCQARTACSYFRAHRPFVLRLAGNKRVTRAIDLHCGAGQRNFRGYVARRGSAAPFRAKVDCRLTTVREGAPDARNGR
jgi:hypothetical protein